MASGSSQQQEEPKPIQQKEVIPIPKELVGIPGAYIFPPHKRFDAYLSFKGEKKRCMDLMGIFRNVILEGEEPRIPDGSPATLETRFKNSVFGPFVEASNNWKYSGEILHFLIMNMVYPDRGNELHFRFGDTYTCYRRREFAMMAGLRHNRFDDVWDRNSMCFGGTCYFKMDSESVTVGGLERALKHPGHTPEVLYRLGIVYFIYGYMLGYKETTSIDKDVFYIVEDLDRVAMYPWGEFIWKLTYERICHHIERFKGFPPKEKAYRLSIDGWIPGLQYWAYETLPMLHTNEENPYARLVNPNAIPRMLKWQCY